MTEYKGRLVYEIKKTHPDYELVNNKDGIHEYVDIYKFDQGGYSEDYIRDYILNDLMLVAGGGYSTAHVNVLYSNVVDIEEDNRSRTYILNPFDPKPFCMIKADVSKNYPIMRSDPVMRSNDEW